MQRQMYFQGTTPKHTPAPATYKEGRPVRPSSSTTGPTGNFRTLEVSFGDGYTEVSPDGINTIVPEYGVEYEGTLAEIKELENFIRISPGTPFYWIPYDDYFDENGDERSLDEYGVPKTGSSDNTAVVRTGVNASDYVWRITNNGYKRRRLAPNWEMISFTLIRHYGEVRR